MLKNEVGAEMKESEVSLPSTAGWQLVVNLPSIVDRVVSDLQRQHADTGVPLPRVVVDVPCSQRFEGDAVALAGLLSFWLQDAVRAAAAGPGVASCHPHAAAVWKRQAQPSADDIRNNSAADF